MRVVHHQASWQGSTQCVPPPTHRQVKAWGEAAAAQYAEDGAADGWDSDAGEEETAEEKYIKVGRLCPGCTGAAAAALHLQSSAMCTHL